MIVKKTNRRRYTSMLFVQLMGLTFGKGQANVMCNHIYLEKCQACQKRKELEQGEIDCTDCKMRKTSLLGTCSRCKKSCHNKKTFNVSPQAS